MLKGKASRFSYANGSARGASGVYSNGSTIHTAWCHAFAANHLRCVFAITGAGRESMAPAAPGHRFVVLPSGGAGVRRLKAELRTRLAAHSERQPDSSTAGEKFGRAGFVVPPSGGAGVRRLKA